MFNFLDSPLIKALLSESIPFHEVMNTFDIKTSIAFNFSTNIYGFVYTSRKGNYHIILNGNLSYEAQCRVFLHEIKHIVNDLPNIGYIIGLDMQHEQFEIITDSAIIYMG